MMLKGSWKHWCRELALCLPLMSPSHTFLPQHHLSCTPKDRREGVERIKTQLYLDATTLHWRQPFSSHLCYTTALLLPPNAALLQQGGTVTEVHPHLLSIPQNLNMLPGFAGQQQCCIHSGQACSHSDVFPQLFRLQSCLKDFSCFWNRGKKKKALTHVYTWGAGREITQGKWSGWW